MGDLVQHLWEKIVCLVVRTLRLSKHFGPDIKKFERASNFKRTVGAGDPLETFP